MKFKRFVAPGIAHTDVAETATRNIRAFAAYSSSTNHSGSKCGSTNSSSLMHANSSYRWYESQVSAGLCRRVTRVRNAKPFHG